MGTPPPPSPAYWIGLELRNVTPPPPPSAGFDTLAKTLAGGYAVVAVVLTTIGALQGGLARLLLNHPWYTLLGLLLAGAGIALAFVDAYVVTSPKQWLRWLLVIGALLLFVAGIAILVSFATKSLTENERPAIATTASMSNDGSKLHGHVTALGVKAQEWVYLNVTGYPPNPDSPFLYQTRAGPDRNGKVDLSFEIPVAFVDFDVVRIGAIRVHKRNDEDIDPCFIESGKSEDHSCATLSLPQRSKRPTVSASWEKSKETNVVNATVKAAGIGADDVVLLDVRGASANHPKIFYRSIFAASTNGVVDATAKVPIVETKTKNVCVVGSTITAANSKHLQRQLMDENRTCAPVSFDVGKTSYALISLP